MHTQTNALSNNFVTEKSRVLIVDDDKASAIVTSEALSKNNLAVSMCFTGTDGLNKAREETFDIFILDACMPGISGFDLCRQLRVLPLYRTSIIFICTGLDDKISIDEAFDAGVDDFIQKPVNLTVLCKRVEKEIQKRRMTEEQVNPYLESSVDHLGDYSVNFDVNGNILGKLRPTESLPIKHLFGSITNIFQVVNIDNGIFRVEKNSLIKSVNMNSVSETFFADFSCDGLDYILSMKIVRTGRKRYTLLVIDETDSYREQKNMFGNVNLDDETGYHNEKYMLRYLNELDHNVEANLEAFGVISLHFENLKHLKRLFGHEKAVSYLKNNLEIIEKSISNNMEDYSIYRTEFDEVVIICENCNEKLFRYVVDVISETFEQESINHEVITLSRVLGACHGSISMEKAEQIYKQAKFAVVDAQKHVVNYFHESMGRSQSEIGRLERLLVRDIKRDVLEVYFQPKFDVRTLELSGVETLLRWNSAELGFVSPGKFLPIAESLNLMDKITIQVIDKTFQQIEKWKKQGRHLVPISINLDASNLENDVVVNHLVDKMSEHDISANCLELELTETMMINADGHAIENLHRIRELGIKIAIDDFGTGYSSFNYIQELPLDVLKIDMRFIRHIDRDEKTTAIVRAIINIGHELGLHVVAEGVETESQLETLTLLACDSVQGYLTGRPVSPDKFCGFFQGSSFKR